MRLSHLTVAAALVVAATSAHAVTMDVVGGTTVNYAQELGNNFDGNCEAGTTSCYDPVGDAELALTEQTIYAFDALSTYPGLTFSPAGKASLTVTFLGTEASATNEAVTFGIGGTSLSLNSKTSTAGESYTIGIEDLLGTVPFTFTSDVNGGTSAGADGFVGNAAIAFSEVFNGGRSVYAYFDDSGARDDRDYDDMVVRIDIAPIPLPAAGWMLLAGLGGLYGMRRIRKTA